MSTPATPSSQPVPRRPITDSPWLWVVVYSSFALVAMFVLHNKYGRRQSTLERRYQARERIGWTGLEPEAGRGGAATGADGGAAGVSGELAGASEADGGTVQAASPDAEGQGDAAAGEGGQMLDLGERPYSSSQKTLITLWPIASLLGVIALAGGVMLIRERLSLNREAETLIDANHH